MMIGERIKKIRGDDLQMEFASKLGIHKNTIGKWERGESVPDANNLAKILNTYPWIDPAWLLTGEGEMRREKTEASAYRQSLDNKKFLSNASIIDSYLDSKYYKDIPSKTRGLIYSAFNEHLKHNSSYNLHHVVSIILSEFYIESFCLHDFKITSLIHRLVEEKFKSSDDKREKNFYYYKILDFLADEFFDGKTVAPVSVESEVVSWLNNEIQKCRQSKT